MHWKHIGRGVGFWFLIIEKMLPFLDSCKLNVLVYLTVTVLAQLILNDSIISFTNVLAVVRIEFIWIRNGSYL